MSPRTREPETKRRLLLEAALTEFASSGIAGARIDRIAKRAGISAGLVYTFYGSKEGLFEAIADMIVEQTVTAIPIDGDDLPEYAGRLLDGAEDHPEVVRFMAWYQLDRGGSVGKHPAITAAMAEKVAVIADAQRRGVVTDRFDPGQLLALLLAIANMWQQQGEDVADLVPAGRRRATVVDAVRRLVAP